MHENEIGRVVVDSALSIHRELGSGLLESVYEIVLARVLVQRGLRAARQVSIPIEYNGIQFQEAFRADIVVNNKIILEIKSVENLNNASKKQLLTYLRLAGMKLGFLLNFGEGLMKDGIVRIVNRLEE
jgi:GxxExxY protein